jgi:hypothetical protein
MNASSSSRSMSPHRQQGTANSQASSGWSSSRDVSFSIAVVNIASSVPK